MRKSYCLTKADASIDFVRIEYAFEFIFSKYEKKPWSFFENPTHHFVDKPHEIVATINFTDGKLYSGILGPEEIDDGHTFFTSEIADDRPVKWRDAHSIFDLGNFEIVDSFQWTGRKPIEIFGNKRDDNNGRPIYTEPPRWEIAAIDHRSGDRLLMLVGHDHKDHMFRINTRLNMILNHARMVLEPWEEQLREHEKHDVRKGLDLPEDKRAEWNGILGEMLDRNEPDRPDFDEGF